MHCDGYMGTAVHHARRLMLIVSNGAIFSSYQYVFSRQTLVDLKIPPNIVLTKIR